jgi:prephenate dehydrogenase
MIGIIGFGRFGKMMAGYLARDFEVFVYDIMEAADAIRESGAVPSTLQQACRQDIVTLPVPISALRDVLKEIVPFLKKDALVVDVCSVKEYPAQWMLELLPENISILATHPMFGPDSAADSLAGRKIALCNIRTAKRRYDCIKSYLSSKELVVIETTPQEHDGQIAVSLALTHFIGRTLSEFGATELPIDTEGYKRLLHILEVVDHDTWQLFLDMNRFNPYAGEKRAAFMNAMRKIEEKIKQP